MTSLRSGSTIFPLKLTVGSLIEILSLGMIFILMCVLASGASGATTQENSELHSSNHLRNDITWTISKRSCSEQEPGCHCNKNSRPRGRTPIIITCRCDDVNQVINLKGSEDKEGALTEDTLWTVEECSRVVIHSNSLSAVTGAPFNLQLVNISSLTIQESAFALPSISRSSSDGSSYSDPTVVFKQCQIGEIPPKAFPSSLSSVGFVNCEIDKISKAAIRPLSISEILFENSTVGLVEENALFEATYISGSMILRGSKFGRLERNSIASGIEKMIWSDSSVEHLESNSMSTSIGSASFHRCHFGVIDSHGMAFKDWTRVNFVNNTFEKVNRSGIDLSQYAPELVSSTESVNSTEISGNTWMEVETDFIVTGRQTDLPLAFVRNNTFSQMCDCGKTFASLLSLQGSKSWFHDQLLNNSRCPISEKGMSCLNLNESFLPYEDLQLLCSKEMFMCMNELEEVTESETDIFYTPQLPNRLRIMAIFIGALAVSIVVSLLVTMCVFVLRRKKPHKKSSASSKSICKDMNGGEHGQHDFADIVYKMSQVPSGIHHRPRSTLFEDVEMEDKGVQTMPNELSTDVLEGLREKLSRPDSFWDAKETIDHLYDLIHVKEQSALSSPPDVTMCNNMIGSGASVTVNGKTPPPMSPAPNIPSPSQILTRTPSSVTTSPMRYAQIRSKPKTAPLCDYRDPSDSQMHIYSELTPSKVSVSSPIKIHSQPPGSPTHPNHQLPLLCEYTEPKDVQTHVYAELTHPNNPINIVNSPTKRNVTASPTKKTSPLKTKFFHPHSTDTSSSSLSSEATTTTTPSTPPSQNRTQQKNQQQRPLPSIPISLSSSSVQ